MAEQEVKTKKLVFQDIDMFQNSILNPSSLESIEKDSNDETIKVAKISMSPNSINSEADTISLKNSDNNSISLENNNVDIKTSEANIIGTVNINDNKVLISNSDYNISDMNINIQNSDNNISIVGQNNLSIKSDDNNSSEVTSSYVHAVEESSSKQFLVNGKVCITWDDSTESLLFIQR